MSDIFWNGLFIFLGTVVVAWFQMRTKNAVIVTGERAEVKTEEVRSTLEQATAVTDGKLVIIADTAERAEKVGKDVHTLVNSQHGAALKLIWELAEWKAANTKLTKDIQSAAAAKGNYEEHIRKQALVDAGMTTAGSGATPNKSS